MSRLGQVNAAGDAKALFLKVFAGEVLTTFETSNVFKALHMVRTIANGKSAQFPVSGTATAKYHVAGENILETAGYLNQVKHAEKVINIDSLLTASTMISELDEAQNHYDVRSIYTTELGRALAMKFDKTLAQVAILAARTAATITGGNGGSVLAKGATVETSGSVLAAAIFEAAQKLDEKNVPDSDRVCVLRPAQYNLLVQSLGAVSNANPVGSYIENNVLRIAGVQIVKSNNLPSTNIAAAESGVDTGNLYHADFTNTVAAVFQKGAIGTVKLLDLSLESERKIEYAGTLFVARYAMGHGVLRPECAVEITKA